MSAVFLAYWVSSASSHGQVGQGGNEAGDKKGFCSFKAASLCMFTYICSLACVHVGSSVRTLCLSPVCAHVGSNVRIFYLSSPYFWDWVSHWASYLAQLASELQGSSCVPHPPALGLQKWVAMPSFSMRFRFLSLYSKHFSFSPLNPLSYWSHVGLMGWGSTGVLAHEHRMELLSSLILGMTRPQFFIANLWCQMWFRAQSSRDI